MLRNSQQKFEPLFERPCMKQELAPDTTENVVAALHALTARVDRLAALLESKPQAASSLTVCEALPSDEQSHCGGWDA